MAPKFRGTTLQNAFRWYAHNIPVATGKGVLFRLLRARLTRGIVRASVLPGVVMDLDLAQDIGQALYFWGHEVREIQRFVSLVRPGAIVIDAGANIGVYTLALARAVGPQGMVHAFEPIPSACAYLSANVHLNSLANVVVNQVALSDHTGEVGMHVADHEHIAQSSFSPVSDGRGTQDGQTLAVRCMRVDDYVEGLGIHIVDAMKIDVEGAELLVLRGAERLLAQGRIRIVQCESLERLALALGYSTVDVKRLMHEYGYAPYLASAPELGPVDLDIPDAGTNLLFLREIDAERFISGKKRTDRR